MLKNLQLHETVQSYFKQIYSPLENDIKKTLRFCANELYGEVYYYSVLKLLKYLNITDQDHFLDVGSGLGKLIFHLFLTTNAKSITGIEINSERHTIALDVQQIIQRGLPDLFKNRKLQLICGDFLEYPLSNITIVYLCSTVFSFQLLQAVGEKINTMDTVQKIVSFRKLPGLNKFKMIKKMFLHCSWDRVPCYIYIRKI